MRTDTDTTLNVEVKVNTMTFFVTDHD
jgi:hypothetical protein